MAWGHRPDVDDHLGKFPRSGTNRLIGPMVSSVLQKLSIQEQHTVFVQSLTLTSSAEPRSVGDLRVQLSGEQCQVAEGVDNSLSIGFGAILQGPMTEPLPRHDVFNG